jgi:diguanylate cyclase (GGDEF)-like protein/PAS domain S-box-containing protein
LTPIVSASVPLQRLADVAARVLKVPMAVISTADDGGSWAASPDEGGTAWRARREAPLSRSLCQFAVAAGKPLLMEDARQHPLVLDNPAVWLGEVGYAGIPIVDGEGRVRGSFAAIDDRPRAWSDDDVAVLEQLAAVAGVALERQAGAERRGARGAARRAAGRVSLRMLEKAVETMQLGVTITDLDGRIVYTNSAEARMHGYRVDELIGMHARVFAPPEHAKVLDQEAIGDVSSWSRETTNVRRDGSVFPVLLRSDVVTDARGRPVGIVTCCEDVTYRKRMERQLLHNAFYDPLTGLPNRALFVNRLERSIERARRGDAGFGVLAVGLDRFKLVNDSLGHAAGDALLLAVAGRLKKILRGETMVAHLAGDEFAILLDELDGLHDATRVAARVQEAFEGAFLLTGHELFTTCSIGIALSETGYDAPDDVIRDATMAMYRSKAAGRGSYEVFDQAMHAQAMDRLHLESDLRRALERGELRLHYQPIVSLATGRIAGFEALLRWEHPERGLVQPDEFIDVAEDTGLIGPIGLWVLREACAQLHRLRGHGGDRRLTIAVNLSPRQFAEPDLVEQVAAIVREAEIDPACLKLEITESVIVQHSDAVSAKLAGLKALGLQLYIDDFGTGYSSLSYLHRLPLDALKIDRSFVRANGGGQNLQLVRAIVALAHALDVVVVTEGVETPEVLAELRSLRCEYGQGFFFSRPIEGEHLAALCADDPRW